MYFLDRQLLHFLSLSNLVKGDLMNWEEASWEVSNLSEYDTEYSTICNPPTLGLVLIPGLWNISYARTLCKNIGGDMNVIKDEANDGLVGELALHDSCKRVTNGNFGGVWNGWWDEKEEGVFTSLTNQEEKLDDQSFSNWRGGEPNGNSIENCGLLLMSRTTRFERSWIDESCQGACTSCLVPSMPKFILKGLEFQELPH